MFERFLESGISIAGVDVGESFGNPAGRRIFTRLHSEMSGPRGYSLRPVLLGRSRGGLMALGWAAENPDRVAGFAGIYPVCNLLSYPGLAKAAPAYGMTSDELQAHLGEHNPIDRLAGLAKAAVPLFAIHGDVDAVVPLDANSGLVRERYTALGGAMQLIVPPGQGHNMWTGFFQCRELVEFVRDHSGPSLVIRSPRDLQVIQRSSRDQGPLSLEGRWSGFPARSPVVEARIVVGGQPGEWRRVDLDVEHHTFKALWDVPAGGWHRVEVRAVSGAEVLAESAIGKVGVGEVFVVAGQSNSANHGEEKQVPRTGLVSVLDGEGWRVANDPQPGASGAGGSFMPPFGDAMADRFRVPVGLVACGVGATSVREWLPEGAAFPNPPTLTGNVRQVSGGGWESKGRIYAGFVARMKSLGPHGFRAVLWHQGESDANQADPTRTLPGPLYRDHLERLILDSRRDIGWQAPWFVAQVSYHVPGDEASAEIRDAQAAIWNRGLGFQGPDSDAIKGSLREAGGKGVHFSGAGLRELAARWVEKVGPWLERLVPQRQDSLQPAVVRQH